MRVLVATIRDPGQVGGTSTHIEMLERGLTEVGHEAHTLYLGAGLPQLANKVGIVATSGVLNRMRRGWGMVYAASVRGRLLGRAAERELDRAASAGHPYQVINAQEVYSVPALREVADRHGVPLVLTLHGYPLYESVSEGYSQKSALGLGFLRRAEMRALRLVDAVVTVDSRLHAHVLKLVPERAEEARSLFNFIDTSAFVPSMEGRDELRQKWNIPVGRVVLFCPRRLVKKNGVVSPALALAGLPLKERSRFLLLHAGEGGERAAIEEVVKKAGLADCVRLLGNQERQAIRELYRLSDIVLVPSVHSENVEEATSLAALEAMASGRSLIAGAVGGLAEIVTHGENGLLVPGGDADALREAIVRLADEGALRQRLAEAARAYVVERHSHLAAAQAYAAVYQDAGMRAGRASAARPQAVSAEEGDVSRAAEGTPGGAARWGHGPSPDSAPPISVLGFPLNQVTFDQAVAWVAGCFTRSLPAERMAIAVSFNPELVVEAWHDPRAAEALLEADLCYPDGVGAVWAARGLGARPAERVPGIELAEAVLSAAAETGVGVYFLGAAPGVAEVAAGAWQKRLPRLHVAGVHHGYFGPEEEAGLVRDIRDSGAGMILAALGAPKQEMFLLRHRDDLGAAVALGVGGSFDVWAGVVGRAPAWTRRLGVEWLWRLLSNPRRVRRQMALPRFAWAAMRGIPDDYGPGRAGRKRSCATS